MHDYQTSQLARIIGQSFYLQRKDYMPGVLKDTFIIMAPTGTGKPEKMGDHFPVKEKSGDFDQNGKVREFCPKYWKIRKF